MLPVLLLAAAAVLASGCASPDEPTARHPIVPQKVQDVQAHQQGAAIVLSFTLPSQSTGKEPLGVAPAVEIYRGEVGPGAGGKPVEKAGARLVYTIPTEMMDMYRKDGKIVYRDVLEAEDLTRLSGVGAEWVYAVRTRAARNRPSAESNRVVVRIRPAPETVSGVTATVGSPIGVIENFPPPPPTSPSLAVKLRWSSEPGAEYRVYRAEVAPETVSAADASKASLRTPLVLIGRASFTAADVQAGLPFEDRKVEIGHTYLYIVRRAFLNGKDAGAQDTDVVESTDSKPVVITVTEPIPPAAPQEVQAVVGPAAANEMPSVSLSWAIGSETGVAGYAVYRSEQEGVRGIRLNEELLGAPTYRDTSVSAGRRYFYSVTAVDGSGLESAPSQTVEAQIPPAQP
jgi:hypothetical protein